jgi:hypothetical protein
VSAFLFLFVKEQVLNGHFQREQINLEQFRPRLAGLGQPHDRLFDLPAAGSVIIVSSCSLFWRMGFQHRSVGIAWLTRGLESFQPTLLFFCGELLVQAAKFCSECGEKFQ